MCARRTCEARDTRVRTGSGRTVGRSARVRRATHSHDRKDRWRGRHGGRRGRRGVEMILRAREHGERGNGNCLVNRDHVGEWRKQSWDRCHRGRAAPRTRAGARVPRAVAVWRGIVRLMVVRHDSRAARCGIVGRHGHGPAAMRRAPHDTLRPAQKQGEPDRQYERQGATIRRTVHSGGSLVVQPTRERAREGEVPTTYASFVQPRTSHSTH